MMIMDMVVIRSIQMWMGMLVGFVPDRPPNSPDRIDQTKSDQCPACETAAKRFKDFQPRDRDSKYNSDDTEQYRTQNMSHTAEERDHRCFTQGPVSRFRHHDERQIVIRSQEGMEETYGSGRQE